MSGYAGAIAVGIALGVVLIGAKKYFDSRAKTCGDNLDCNRQLKEDLQSGRVNGGNMDESYDKALGTNALNDGQ